MPPSAISGTSVPCSAAATSPTAVSCGTPTPATMRVVQMEPGPMPTLTASAPASTSMRAASPVAMLPAMTCRSGWWRLISRTRSITPLEWPWAVSTTTTSTPAATSFSSRSWLSPPVPRAAPTRSLPELSFEASGWVSAFRMSLTVMRPRSSKASLTTSTRSRRCLCMSFWASSGLAPSRTVIRRSFGVMMLRTGWSSSDSKRRSRLVTIPTTLPRSTTGRPEM